MKRGVMVAKTKRRGVRRSARFGDQPRLERRPWRRHARRLPRSRPGVGRVNDLDFRVVRDGAGSPGEHSAEKVDLFGHGQ
jgi:hypothetical protein